MAGRPPEPDDEREPAPDDDIDVRFRDITANLGDLTVPPDEPLQEPSTPLLPDPGPDETGSGPRDYMLGPEVEADDEAFTPPEPPRLGGGDPVIALAWTGVVVPIFLVLVYLLLWRGMPLIVLVLSAGAFVLSVGVLVWRMPGKRGDPDDDDGAVL